MFIAMHLRSPEASGPGGIGWGAYAVIYSLKIIFGFP
ncbi:MAG: hypothetical protein K0S33_2482 [Bacteroidetes bacterium]|jgi:hypothetical protein|nr:hypothetical protein [Bacteroidota bacterium]